MGDETAAGRMPSLHLSAKEAAALATYLLREQINNPQIAKAAPLRSSGSVSALAL